MKVFSLLLAAISLCQAASSNGVIQKFELWGHVDEAQKAFIFMGSTNGFFQASAPEGAELLNCLYDTTLDQDIAIINKYYKDDPEKWARPVGEQILEAITISSGQCAGKKPTKHVSN